MSSALPYDSLPPRLSPGRPALPYDSLSPGRPRVVLDWEREQLATRRPSSPRGLDLLSLPSLPRRGSAVPGYLLSPYRDPRQDPRQDPLHRQDRQDRQDPQQQQQRRSLSSSLCSEASLAPPVAPPPPGSGGGQPCCLAVGVMPLLRLALLAFSVLFWAAGLALFTLGVWAQASLADYMLLSAHRYPNAPLVLLATGAAVTAWGFLGCLGVAAKLPCVLRAYGFFQLAALVAGLAAGLSGLFYRQDIAGGFRSGLQRAVAGYAHDEGRADALDSLQRALECCGAEGWRDWLTSDWANQDNAGFFSATGGDDNATSWVSLPDSCCVRRKACRNRPLPSTLTLTRPLPSTLTLTRPLPSTDAEAVVAAGIHPHGCFRKVFSFVNDNVFHIAATVLGLAFTQIGGIALACLLANRLAPRPPPLLAPH